MIGMSGTRRMTGMMGIMGMMGMEYDGNARNEGIQECWE